MTNRPRQKNDQVPLGELLTKARLDRRMSRADVAKETGVSENSLARYEKAGLESDGQYPPAPKLAVLCFHLGISPMLALYGSLTYKEYWKYIGRSWEADIINHPDYNWLSDEYLAVLQDNRRLRSLLKHLLRDDQLGEPEGNFEKEVADTLLRHVKEIIKREDAFDKQLAANDPDRLVFRYGGITTPGTPPDRRAELKPDQSNTRNENGPVHEGPSRSDGSPTGSKAVGAAQTKPKKKRGRS